MSCGTQAKQFMANLKVAKSSMVLAMQVVVLALQGAFDLGLLAILDTLGTANELASTMGGSAVAVLLYDALRLAGGQAD
jgi:hypothetical protein